MARVTKRFVASCDLRSSVAETGERSVRDCLAAAARLSVVSWVARSPCGERRRCVSSRAMVTNFYTTWA
eukprot:2126460-Prymnesium_polylepis.1